MKTAIEMARQKFPRKVPEFLPFGGGLDLVTPAMSLPPGRLRATQNYECDVNGGYARVMGYERFDGRTSPSSASYATMNVIISGAFAANDTITGVTSAATAVVIAVVAATLDPVASAYLVITKIVGTFVSGETLNVAAAPQGVTSSAATVDGGSTALLHAQYKNLAADEYRDDIAAPTGSGGVLGGFRFNGVTYAFRNNAGGTAAVLHKSTAGGWSAVALGRELAFTSGGVTEITEGQTITGATSGATAVLTRVMLTSGTWAAGTAAGKFIFASQTGTFQAENINVGASPNLATIAGNSSAITLGPSGRFEALVTNFGGTVNTRRVYGCDGVNRGWEFDGTVFCPIDTGMTTDTPLHVGVNKKQLFFSFGASAQHAAPGTPYIWSVILGAGELGMGDTITGFKPQPGSETAGAFAIFTRNRTSILYGNGVADWNLVPYREELGAYAYTILDAVDTMFLDDRGITNFQTAQSYGNFAHAAISALIRPWLNVQRTKAVASCVVRDKNQYRLFFSDQYALYVTMNGRKVVGMMPVLLAHVPTCAWSDEESDGSETVWFGASNGKVYQMEKGTSFDGDAIEHYLHLVYNFSRSPDVLKDYKKCVLEVTGTGYAAWQFSFSLGYGSSNLEQPGTQSAITSLSPLYWDSSGVVWDALFWDGQSLVPESMPMEGSAENMSIILQGSSDYHSAIRFSGARVQYIPRRLIH